jgi:hypothetical protein
VKRSFALRYEGLVQQVKVARAMCKPENLEASLKRIDEVERKAISLGFEAIVNSKGRRAGIGQVMPPITAIVSETLDEEITYRLLSAVTHANQWAVQQLSFDVLPMSVAATVSDAANPYGLRALKKAAKPVCFQYLADQAMKAFTTPVLYKTKLFGGDYELLVKKIRLHEQRVHERAKAIEFVPEEEAG